MLVVERAGGMGTRVTSLDPYIFEMDGTFYACVTCTMYSLHVSMIISVFAVSNRGMLRSSSFQPLSY